MCVCKCICVCMYVCMQHLLVSVPSLPVVIVSSEMKSILLQFCNVFIHPVQGSINFYCFYPSKQKRIINILLLLLLLKLVLKL